MLKHLICYHFDNLLDYLEDSADALKFQDVSLCYESFKTNFTVLESQESYQPLLVAVGEVLSSLICLFETDERLNAREKDFLLHIWRETNFLNTMFLVYANEHSPPEIAWEFDLNKIKLDSWFFSLCNRKDEVEDD